MDSSITPRYRRIAADTTVPVMTATERRHYWLFVSAWLAANLAFWAWWLRSVHIVTVARFIFITAPNAYIFLVLPCFFFFFVGRMRRPNPALVFPPGQRVTFVTTFVPGSETIDVLARTIVAMRDQEGYPHDVWVLDEGDTANAKALCARVGARHFSRKNMPEYQETTWPFQARMKAGNYNSWLDWITTQGIGYDIIMQMDTDHVPQPGYMMEMLRPFADPAVAYVAAPSITNGNQKESWVVGARSELESAFHGPLQAGFSGGYAPMIIGSHAAFRVAALRRIGGFQHTWAEDHHNALRLNAHGMPGVFSPDAIAVGDGGACFADAMVQEYQWARALTQILLKYFPRDGRTLPLRMWLQFAFTETWYPLYGLSFFMGWLSPIVALLTERPMARVNYFQFVGMQSAAAVLSLLLIMWIKRRGWLRPRDSAIVTWRTAFLVLARWPFILMAVVEAVIGWILNRDFPIRVTPKGTRGTKALPLRVLAPYIVIIAGCLLAVAFHLLRGHAREVDGYVFLALWYAALYLVFLTVILWRNAVENARHAGVTRQKVRRMHAAGFSLATALAFLFVILLPFTGGRAVQALTWQPASGGSSLARVAPGDDTAESAPVAAPRDESRGDLSTPTPSVALPATFTGGDQGRDTLMPRRMPLTFPTGRPFLGFYNPAGETSMGPADVEEIFVPLQPGIGSDISAHATRILQAGRIPVITIEPYPSNAGGLSGGTLLADLAGGRYDGSISAAADAVRAFAPQPVYIRFAHEMDLQGHFPWAQGDPVGYKAAYRHFVDTFRLAGATNARWVWSPSGNDGSASYYPGDDVVDMIGVTVLVAQPWEEAAGFATPRSFLELMRERYSLSARFGKPMIVAELGVAISDPKVERVWLEDARRALTQFPELRGVIYFDAQNPPVPVVGLALPDWRLTDDERATVLGLVAATPTKRDGSASPLARIPAERIEDAAQFSHGTFKGVVLGHDGSLTTSAAEIAGKPATFTGAPIDAGRTAMWLYLRAKTLRPPGTDVIIETRTSDDGAVWGAFQPLGAGGRVISPPGRYLQYRLLFKETAATAPSVEFVYVSSTVTDEASDPKPSRYPR